MTVYSSLHTHKNDFIERVIDEEMQHDHVCRRVSSGQAEGEQYIPHNRVAITLVYKEKRKQF